MNETEKRREELLAQARNLYGSGRTSNPAIHPRCQGAYHQLYEKEEALGTYKASLSICSTFVLRVCVSLILFLIFAGIDYEKTSVGTYDSAKIIEAITYQQPVGEFLK